jgi:signal transduction histidine kinase
VDQFYAEVGQHAGTRRVITGGEAQIERLKGALLGWLRELFSGKYDADYVARRSRVGFRHVEIGLDQVYTNVALSQVRRNISTALETCLANDVARLLAVQRSLDLLIDLDLAIIEDAYQTEYAERHKRIERLATIGQVAGGIAHELRNPLNVVKTSVYYLLNARQPAPAKIEEHLHRIERQVGVADSVISALSDFAKLPVPDLQPVPVQQLIEESLRAEGLPPQIEITIDCADSLPRVLVDSRQMRIALSNLIRNARDAMPDGGRLTIGAVLSDGHLDVSVKDTGAGIPAENLRSVMEPFFSTKPRGIGLGLALARAILEKNRGSLRVESELGRGSTFVMRLICPENDSYSNRGGG